MSERYAVRMRGDGWAAVDTEGSKLEKRFKTQAQAMKQCDTWTATDNARTYSVMWYCEVDASSPEEATKKARKFLAPSYRDNWEPFTIDEVEP